MKPVKWDAKINDYKVTVTPSFLIRPDLESPSFWFCVILSCNIPVSRLYTPTSNASSSSQQPGNAVKRWWCLTRKAALRSPRTSKHPGVALKFILGPAVLTVSARLFSRVAYCEADVNNNIPLEAAAKKPPEFKWHILWEFIKPQLFALVGAVVVRFNPLPLMLIQRYARFMEINRTCLAFLACICSSHPEY